MLARSTVSPASGAGGADPREPIVVGFARSAAEHATFAAIAQEEFRAVLGVDLGALFPDFGTELPEKRVVVFRCGERIVGGVELWHATLSDCRHIPFVNRLADPRALIAGLTLPGESFSMSLRFALAAPERSWARVMRVVKDFSALERSFCDTMGIAFKIMVADHAHQLLYELATDEILADGLVLHDTGMSIVADDYGGSEFLFSVVYRASTPAAAGLEREPPP